MGSNSTKKCSNCGAPVSQLSSICSYCSAPIVSDRSIGEDEKERIESVVHAMEENLQVAKENSVLIWIFFLVFSLLSIGSYFLYNYLLGEGVRVTVLTVITAVVLFLFWGGLIELTENKKVKEAYNNELVEKINDYLLQMNYNRYDFDVVADNVLEKKALLRRFLFTS